MKTRNVTFSLPSEIIESLQSLIEKQKMSQFAAKAIARALEEEKKTLKNAYLQANKDKDRLKTIEDWKSTELEGWDE